MYLILSFSINSSDISKSGTTRNLNGQQLNQLKIRFFGANRSSGFFSGWDPGAVRREQLRTTDLQQPAQGKTSKSGFKFKIKKRYTDF